MSFTFVNTSDDIFIKRKNRLQYEDQEAPQNVLDSPS